MASSEPHHATRASNSSRRKSYINPDGALKGTSIIPVAIDEDHIDLEFDQDEFYTWVRDNFQIPVCYNFVVNPKARNRCRCGRTREAHPEAGTVVLSPDVDWNPADHCRMDPTDSFGMMNFMNEDAITMPKFIKVGTRSYDESTPIIAPEHVDAIKELLLERWELTAPGLLISVTGGAKSFKLSTTMAHDFQQGLMKAAKATDAWIITGGNNCGVMGLVGDAVAMSVFTSSIVTIGVANWGKTMNRDMLHVDNAKDDLVIDYKVGANVKGQASLDPHHTHFFLVDDGMPNKSGCEIRYRIQLQDIMQDMFSMEGRPDNRGVKGMGLPKVSILVEGGEQSIDTVLNSVEHDNPLLVLKGTGRAADIICLALEESEMYESVDTGVITKHYRIKNGKVKEVKGLVGTYFHKYGPEIINRIFEKIVRIVECFKWCYIYDNEDEGGLDFAILLALITSITDSGAAMRQMKLAIMWDQPLVAKKYILSKHTFKSNQLNSLLDSAIEEHSVDFIRLLLYQGADLKEYLTVDTLIELYNELPESSISFRLLASLGGDNEITLINVGELMEKILEGKYRSPLRDLDVAKNGSDTFFNPYDLMVIYAALICDVDMARLFWEFSKAPSMCALVAMKIFYYLIEDEKKQIQVDDDLLEVLRDAADQFEELAIGVMNGCAGEYSRKHLLMFLTVDRAAWSDINLVEMAEVLRAKKFIAHVAYQSYLTDLWMGKIHHTTNPIVICLACMMPPAILALIQFDKQAMTETEKAVHTEKKAKGNSAPIRVTLHSAKKKKKEKRDPNMRHLVWHEKLYEFYHAPVIKFVLNVLSYVIFLMMYAWALLFGAKWNDIYPRCVEIVDDTCEAKGVMEYTDIYLLLWILATIPLEISQVLESSPITMSKKFKKYLSNTYNCADLTGMLTFLTAFFLKLTVSSWSPNPYNLIDTFNIYRLLNIGAFAMYLLRFVQLFEIHSELGPKLFMIRKMLKDLYFFIFVLFVYMFGFMVVSEALMNPVRSDTFKMTFRRTFQRAFFNVFGDIDHEGYVAAFESFHCTNIIAYTTSSFSKDTSIQNKYSTYSNWMTTAYGFETAAGCEEASIDTVNKHFNFTEISYILCFILLCIYLLFSNVMLMNLLIAIFSKTYEEVETESDIIFREQRAQVITEFDGRTPLPNPLSLLFYARTFLVWAYQHSRGCYGKEKKVKEKLSDVSIEYKVGLIEAECRAALLEDEDAEERHENRFMYQLEKQQKKSYEQIKKITAMVEDMASSMEIMTRSKIAPVTELWKRIFSHKFSRESPYPGTDIKRYPTPDNKISWEIKFNEYDPEELNLPNKLFDEKDDPYQITFNVDAEGINRMSSLKEYTIQQGRPINPKGRTGLTGRAALERWGPNHVTSSLVSRWCKRAGSFVTIEQLRVLEVVAVKRVGQEKLDLPGGYVEVGETLSEGHKRNFSENCMGINEMNSINKLTLMQNMDKWMQSGIILYKGYFDDSRNTDNSWLEMHAVNFHQEGADHPIRFEAGDFIEKVEWVQLDGRMKMNSNNLWMLKKMCIHLGAHNPYKGEVLI